MEATTRHYRGGGLVWPVILIGAGIVFLLNNLGVLAWNVWETMFRLWPVLLIAVGLDILIGRRSILASALVALVLLVVLGVAIATGFTGGRFTPGIAVASTETVSQDLQGATSADVEIAFGTGNFGLAALPEGSGKLIEGTVDLSTNERLVNEQPRLSNGKARYALKSENSWNFGTNITTEDNKQWELELNRDIPLALKLSTGVGRSTIDLSQLQLSQLDINGGVGEVSAKLPQRGRFSVDIDGGIGEITLSIPKGLATRIEVSGGLGNIDVRGDFDRRDREYTSRGYSSAQDRAEIKVSGGIGRIVVRELTE